VEIEEGKKGDEFGRVTAPQCLEQIEMNGCWVMQGESGRPGVAGRNGQKGEKGGIGVPGRRVSWLRVISRMFIAGKVKQLVRCCPSVCPFVSTQFLYRLTFNLRFICV